MSHDLTKVLCSFIINSGDNMKVLMFNISGKKSIEIKNLCRKMYVEYNEIGEEYFGSKLRDILDSAVPVSASSGSFFDEMLYFYGFSETLLDIFLVQLRKKGASVALKAVSTETNLGFTPYELYKEISAEHLAMSGGGSSVHQT